MGLRISLLRREFVSETSPIKSILAQDLLCAHIFEKFNMKVCYNSGISSLLNEKTYLETLNYISWTSIWLCCLSENA